MITSTSTNTDRRIVQLLHGLVDSFPNPDDPRPPGPGGPVIGPGWLLASLWPRFGRLRVPWDMRPDPLPLGPQPDPWMEAWVAPSVLRPAPAYAVALAQMVIGDACEALELGASLGDGAGTPAAFAARLTVFVDDCGTRYPGWRRVPVPHPPRPGPPIGNKPGPLELILMGIQFTDAAKPISRADADLGRSFADAGERLIDLGLTRA